MIEALYLHIPYCKQKCAYCSFYSMVPRQGSALIGDDNDKLTNPSDTSDTSDTSKTPNTSKHLLDTTTCTDLQSYVESLSSRIDELGKASLLAHVETLYIGGGTPSLLSANQIASLLKSVQETRGAAQQGQLREITVEANPESLTSDFLDACKEQGVTRISLGIQSMHDVELAAVERCSRVEDNVRAVALLKSYPFAVSVDVMVGLPEQTGATLERTIQTLLAFEKVGHVSVYPLSVEPGTPLYMRQQTGSVQIPNEDAQASLLERANKLLQKSGFRHYEVANYAKLGCEAQHNIAYWTGKEYLGLGPSASSMVSRRTYDQLSDIETSLPSVSQLPDGLSRIRFTEKVQRTQSHDSAPRQTPEIIATPTISASQATQAPKAAPAAQAAQAASRDYELEGLTYEQSVAEDLMLASRLASGLNEAIIGHAQDALGAKKVTSVLQALCDQGFLQRPQSQKACSTGVAYAPTNKGWLLGNIMFSRLWDLAPTTKTFMLSSHS